MTIQSGGSDRSFTAYLPASYSATKPAPIVFDFHGFGSNAAQQMVYGDFRPLADAHGLIVVAPNGQGQAASRHFNLTNVAGEADDVAFTLAVLDRFEASMCVDTRRVYSAGMSDGGGMTSLLACRASDRFAAFGPVAVVFYDPQCATARSVPIAAFQGTADPIVPFNGGAVHCCGGAVVPAAPASMASWAAHDGCGAQPVEDQLSPMVLLRRWSGCSAGAEVRFYIIEGGGHTWPGGAIRLAVLGPTTSQISASDTLWAFFAQHPLPT